MWVIWGKIWGERVRGVFIYLFWPLTMLTKRCEFWPNGWCWARVRITGWIGPLIYYGGIGLKYHGPGYLVIGFQLFDIYISRTKCEILWNFEDLLCHSCKIIPRAKYDNWKFFKDWFGTLSSNNDPDLKNPSRLRLLILFHSRARFCFVLFVFS